MNKLVMILAFSEFS